MSEKQTPRQQADELLAILAKGRVLHNMFVEDFKKTLLISGEPIEIWKDKFYLRIPTDNMTPPMCKELGMKVMEMHQEVTFYYATAVAKSQMIKRGNEASFHNKFASIYQESKMNKKRVAAATLENLAKIDSQDIDSALTQADIEVKFWKSILEHLSTCRKIIENASLNISVELKAQINERYIDSINRSANGG